jgi:sugar O-acyltransferase (sialic acid O-acetyltransferase NeuD family)
MKNKLLIIGASGHGKVVADIALKMNKWQNIAFLDDNENVKSSMGIEVIGKSSDTFMYIEEYDIFVGIGNNSIREKIQMELESKGASIPILIHPSAIIGEQVVLGAGTVLMARTVINCCSIIGNGCIINTGVTIDHDNFIDDYVHISPGANLAGTVKIGKGTWLGIGSIVINNITIYSGIKVGAGAVVVKDITDTGIYVGVPARRINNYENISIS